VVPGAGAPSLELGDSVKLTSLGAKAAAGLGADYVAFQLTPGAGDDEGVVRARVDYSGFAKAFGADYASRLQLVSYPACSLTSPQVAGCLTSTPVVSENDAVTHEVSAVLPVGDVAVAGIPVEPSPAPTAGLSAARADVAAAADASSGTGTVFALTAGASGPSGTYTATDLSPTGAWSVGEQSG
jgi:hypothetical protein